MATPLLLAHRGNIDGKQPERENSPSYILEAIDSGYSVEVDVWLADNEWFGLNIYCCVVANEGWHGQGASLISQRRHDTKSDIAQSGRTENKT